MERAICAHLMHCCGSLQHLTNTNVPVGTPTDTLVRLLTQYYICLNNICKHLVARHAILPVVYSHIKFEKLIQVSGKPLAARVYDLITYIDKNLLPVEEGPSTVAKKRKVAPQKTKKKVIRETRSLPKLIRWIEMLHKIIFILGKKTSKDLSGYLHIGIVRDFRIHNLNVPGDENSSNEENVTGNNGDDSEEESSCMDTQGDSGTAREKILKNVAKLKRKQPTKVGKAAPARGKRARSAVVVPDVAGILSAINVPAVGPKSPAKKRARRSTKTT